MLVIASPLSAELVLPWCVNKDQEVAYKRILRKVLSPVLALLLSIPWLPVFEKEYIPPENMIVKTKVLLKHHVIEQSNHRASKRTAKAKSIRNKSAQKARKPTQGIAAFSKQLSALRAAVDVKMFQNKNTFNTSLGDKAHNKRTLLGHESATKLSQGIKVSDRDLSETAMLATHRSTEIDSPIQIFGVSNGRDEGYSSGIDSRRDMESIRRIFERSKGAVFSLYTQSLRSHPELRGKFLFQLVIEPDGSISDLKLLNSDLGVSDLERNILTKIGEIHFGAEDVIATVVQYMFIFLPS